MKLQSMGLPPLLPFGGGGSAGTPSTTMGHGLAAGVQPPRPRLDSPGAGAGSLAAAIGGGAGIAARQPLPPQGPRPAAPSGAAASVLGRSKSFEVSTC